MSYSVVPFEDATRKRRCDVTNHAKWDISHADVTTWGMVLHVSYLIASKWEARLIIEHEINV